MSDRRLQVAVATLATAGVAIASYLTYTRYMHSTIVCVTGGCETVQASRYSELLGVPVALLGLAAYLIVLGTAFLRSELARMAGAVTAVAGMLFGIYLLLAQVVDIDAVCQWCLASDVVLDLLAVACLLRLRSSATPSSAERTASFRARTSRRGAERPVVHREWFVGPQIRGPALRGR